MVKNTQNETTDMVVTLAELEAYVLVDRDTGEVMRSPAIGSDRDQTSNLDVLIGRRAAYAAAAEWGRENAEAVRVEITPRVEQPVGACGMMPATANSREELGKVGALFGYAVRNVDTGEWGGVHPTAARAWDEAAERDWRNARTTPVYLPSALPPAFDPERMPDDVTHGGGNTAPVWGNNACDLGSFAVTDVFLNKLSWVDSNIKIELEKDGKLSMDALQLLSIIDAFEDFLYLHWVQPDPDADGDSTLYVADDSSWTAICGQAQATICEMMYCGLLENVYDDVQAAYRLMLSGKGRRLLHEAKRDSQSRLRELNRECAASRAKLAEADEQKSAD